jgi:uncharacterized protein with ParB-like and HNH nuclease domain
MIPSENTFAQLIGIEGNQWHYHIPRFQREYVWGKYNWSKLLEDIYDNEPGHYMGSVICVHESTEYGPASELIYEVVDGQQRLTTLSILIAAIFSKLNKEVLGNNPELKEEDDFIILRNSIRKRLIKQLERKHGKLPFGIFKSGDITYCLRVQPSTQESNLEDYQYILSEAGLLKDVPYPRNCGNKRLHKTYNYFRKNIPDDYKGLTDLIDRIYKLSFIHISESSQSKAFLLFETLNFRGVPLSAIDIIKNKMLATLENKHAIPIEDAYDKWQKLLENLPEDRDQDRFLRQFYNAFKYRPEIKIDRIPKATGSTIIGIYETHIKKDAQFIFNELLEKSRIYNQFIEPEKYSNNSKLFYFLIDLERIGAAASYAFLLYLFSLPEESFYTDAAVLRETVVGLLCKYYFRRNITDFPNTRDLDAINIDLVEACERKRNNNEQITIDFIQNEILKGRGKPADIDTLRKNLTDNIFYNNEGMARYALAKLDETSHSREYAPNLWARNEKGLFVWTIEHIFPQGKNIPKEWVTMLGGKEEAQKVYDEMVHSFGNLTLSGYNSKLSNQSFEKKQGKYEANILGNKIHLGYKNGLALNNIEFEVDGNLSTLANCENWTRKHIEARNLEMVDMLLQLFKFEHEKIINA